MRGRPHIWTGHLTPLQNMPLAVALAALRFRPVIHHVEYPQKHAQPHTVDRTNAVTVGPPDKVEKPQADVTRIHQRHSGYCDLNVAEFFIESGHGRVKRQAVGECPCFKEMSADSIYHSGVHDDREPHLNEHHYDQRTKKANQYQRRRDRERSCRQRGHGSMILDGQSVQCPGSRCQRHKNGKEAVESFVARTVDRNQCLVFSEEELLFARAV